MPKTAYVLALHFILLLQNFILLLHYESITFYFKQCVRSSGHSLNKIIVSHYHRNHDPFLFALFPSALRQTNERHGQAP